MDLINRNTRNEFGRGKEEVIVEREEEPSQGMSGFNETKDACFQVENPQTIRLEKEIRIGKRKRKQR